MNSVMHSTIKPISHFMQSIEHAAFSVFDVKAIRQHIHMPVGAARMAQPVLIEVLDEAANDPSFIARLTDQGSKALSGYKLMPEEKAAIISGDIRWIEAHIGPLTDHQKIWLMCRLEQENW